MLLFSIDSVILPRFLLLAFVFLIISYYGAWGGGGGVKQVLQSNVSSKKLWMSVLEFLNNLRGLGTE
jgi:hypothetical protein